MFFSLMPLFRRNLVGSSVSTFKLFVFSCPGSSAVYRINCLQFKRVVSSYVWHFAKAPSESHFLFETLIDGKSSSSLVNSDGNESSVSNVVDLIPRGSLNLRSQAVYEPNFLQLIAKEAIRKLDDLSSEEAFRYYKILLIGREPRSGLDSNLDSQSESHSKLEEIASARYLLISYIAYRIEALHFDGTDISLVCEYFRRINKEIYSKEAINILVKSISSLSYYMRSKNSSDIIAGFTTVNGSKILKEVLSSGDKENISRYREMINLSLNLTGRLTNTSFEKSDPKCSRYLTDCFIRLLTQEDEYCQATFWSQFLSEINANREQLDLASWQNVLTLINRFRIYSPEIIDNVAPIVVENAQTYLRSPQISPIPYIRLMNECYHKPSTVDWNKFINLLLHPKKQAEVPLYRILSLLSRLVVLEDYSKIEDFDLKHVRSTLVYPTRIRSGSPFKQLLSFYSGLYHELEASPLKKRLITELNPFLIAAIEILNPEYAINLASPLLSILETAFGGSQFVLNGVWTKSGIHIPHLMVFRRGDYPVAIRNESHTTGKINYFHDISIPPEGKTVAILPTYSQHYCNNSSILRGKVQFNLRLMKLLDIIPVVADMSEFESKVKHERVPWLINKIRTELTEHSSDAWGFFR